LVVQSTELEDGSSSQQQQENVIFSDAGLSGLDTTPMVSYRPDTDLASGLGSYLQRPVAISNFTWAEGSTTAI